MELDPATIDAQRLEFIREQTRLAVLIDLRDYNWMSLDPETALKIHELLPHEQ